jgi:hypothetical protein
VPSRRVVGWMFALAALFAWCGWVSGFHRGTNAAIETWGVSVVAVVVINVVGIRGLAGRPPKIRLAPDTSPTAAERPERPHRVLGLSVPWLVLVAITLCWELLGIDTGPDVPHLTISALSEAYRPLNAALLLWWISVGFGYAAALARRPLDSKPIDAATGPGQGSAPAFLVGAGHSGGRGFALLLPHVRAAGVAFWIAVIAAGVVIDRVGRVSYGRIATAEQFVRSISRTRLARSALIAAWLFAGWHLFAK